MPTTRLTEEQRQQCAGVDNATLRHLSRAWGVPFNTLRRIRSEENRAAARVQAAQRVPPASDRRPVEPVTLTDWAAFLYAADLHAPCHSVVWVERLLHIARMEQYSRLIIGGDLFDFSSVSRHPKDALHHTVGETLAAGGALLQLFLETFTQVAVLPGNHDARVARKLDDPLPFDALVYGSLRGGNPGGALIVSPYEYIYIDYTDERAGWVVGHPHNYSKQPTKVEGDIAERHQRNVIGAHTHLCGMSVSSSGRFIAVSPGCMTDADLHGYVMQRKGMSKYPAWVPGFVGVRGGQYVTLYNEHTRGWE